MDLTRYSILFLIWANLCLHSLGKALKSCRSRSSRCRPTTTTTTGNFRCPDKGHYALPSDVFSFYKCSGAGYEPCLCSCKHEEMCFDPLRRRCRFAFLDSVRNCSGKAGLPTGGSGRRSFITAASPSVLLDRSPPTQTLQPIDSVKKESGVVKSPKDLPEANEVLKKPEVAQINGISPENEDFTSAGTGWFGQLPTVEELPTGHGQIPTETEALAARHSAKKGPPAIIEDYSRFPAWAISLLVLCVVIALVLVVMVLY